MTNPNYTHITVLLDESGSMGSLAEDTRGGFNTFLAEQKAVPGKATMTVCKFSSGFQLLCELQDIQKVKPLTAKTYSPMGGTALLDAMGRCISDLGAALGAMAEEDRPGKVLFLVVTDGEENESKAYTKEQIAKMVKLQENEYKWNFLYLGANVDAFGESSSIGIRASNAIGYTASAKGVQHAYSVTSASLGAIRGLAASDMQYDVFNSSHVDELVGQDAAERFKDLSAQIGNIAPISTSTVTPPPENADSSES